MHVSDSQSPLKLRYLLKDWKKLVWPPIMQKYYALFIKDCPLRRGVNPDHFGNVTHRPRGDGELRAKVLPGTNVPTGSHLLLCPHVNRH